MSNLNSNISSNIKSKVFSSLNKLSEKNILPTPSEARSKLKNILYAYILILFFTLIIIFYIFTLNTGSNSKTKDDFMSSQVSAAQTQLRDSSPVKFYKSLHPEERVN